VSVQVFKVCEGECFASCEVNREGKILSVEGVSIALEAEARDCRTLRAITHAEGSGVVRGLDGKAGRVADIEIPPREYRFEETGEGEERTTERVALPFDLNAVVLRLRPCGVEQTARENTTQEEG
jgi:hypothetical protein